MVRERIYKIPKGTLKVTLLILLGLALLSFALTQTKLGREGLSRQLQAQFNRTYQGSLSIGTLEGNLVNDLYARDVAIHTPDGHPLLFIDSVVVQASWLNLFRQSITLRQLQLFRPHFSLTRGVVGPWNLTQVFKRRRPNLNERPPWTFSSAFAEIIDGTLSIQNDGPRPQGVAQGTIYDVTNTEIAAIESRFSIDWDNEVKLIDLLHLNGYVPELGRPIHHLQGQWTLDGPALSVQALQFETAESRLDVSLQLDISPPSIGPKGKQPPPAITDLRILQSIVSPDDWMAFFPGIPFPFNQKARFSARMQGSMERLTLSKLEVTTGKSFFKVEGSVVGLPDSARYQFTLDAPSLLAADFRATPSNDPRWTRFSRGALGGTASGTLRFQEDRMAWSSKNILALQHPAGEIEGNISLAKSFFGPLTHNLDLTLTDVDLSQWPIGNPPATLLNGRLISQGSGTTLDSLRTSTRLQLGNASWDTHPMDSLRLALEWTDRQATVDLNYVYGPQALETIADIDFRQPDPSYTIATRLRTFDFFDWLPPPHPVVNRSSRVSGTLWFTGSGAQMNRIQGEGRIVLDPSRWIVEEDTTVLAAATHDLTIQRSNNVDTHVAFKGDWVEADLHGPFSLDVFVETATLWEEALMRSLHETIQKPYAIVFESTTPDSLAFQAALKQQAQVEDFLQSRGFNEPLSLSAQVRIKDSTWLSPWVPGWSAPLKGLVFRAEGSLDAQHLDLSLRLNTDSLSFPSTFIHPLTASLQIDTPYAPVLNDVLTAEARIHAPFVNVRDRSFTQVNAEAKYRFREGQLEITSANTPTTDNIDLTAQIDLLPDRNRLTLKHASINTTNYTWATQRPARVDAYQDAYVLSGLLVEGYRTLAPDLEQRQRVRLEGVLSDRPDDALTLTAEHIRLDEWSDAMAMNYPLGGALNASVTLKGGLAQPEAQGQINVEALSINNRNLGTFRLSSQYDPTEAGRLFVEAVVFQPDPNLDTAQDNDVRITGSLRLPGLRAQTLAENPGALDLAFEARRLDLFFFDYIFKFLDQAQGYAVGSGTIKGTFAQPVFDASFEARDAAVTLPEFNLRYQVAGPFKINREGFQFDGIAVTDQTGGTAQVTGGILFNAYKFFSFDLVGILQDFQIIDVANSQDLPFYGHIWASGTASLTGPLYNAELRSSDAVTSTRSELFIPILAVQTFSDETFITFVDSTSSVQQAPQRRRNVLASRPRGERSFLDGLNMNLNIAAPPGSTVHLVFDPLLGDVMNAVGQGRIQFQRRGGEYTTFGTFTVDSGDYLFTAQDVFARRFILEPGGTIVWDNDPLDPLLTIPATYRTRASLAGLPVDNPSVRVPMVIQMNLSNRVTSPLVDLSLKIDRDERSFQQVPELLETVVNQPDRAAEYATSVLLTNSFLLTTSQAPDFADAANQLFFTSLSQLVASQFNRFANEAFNLDLNFGVQQNNLEALDLTYGFALRLQDERLIIRGEGIYEGGDQPNDRLRGALVIEYQLTPNVLVEAFYRREDDFLESSSVIGTSYGAGLVYQTEFATWKQFRRRVRGTVPAEEIPPPLRNDKD